jgi:hypothetical protein
MNKVRKVIRSIIQEQYELLTKVKEPVQLSSDTNAEVTIDSSEILMKAWPKKITYKGKLLFDFYEKAKEIASKKLNIDKIINKTIDSKDVRVSTTQDADYDRYMTLQPDEREKLEDEDYVEKVFVSGQVVYLGYIPSSDKFIMGFEMNDKGPVFSIDLYYNVSVEVKIDDLKEVSVDNVKVSNPYRLSDHDDLYKKIHADNKNIIDIYVKRSYYYEKI